MFMGAGTRTRLVSQNKSVLEADIVKRSLPYNVVSGDCGITAYLLNDAPCPSHSVASSGFVNFCANHFIE